MLDIDAARGLQQTIKPIQTKHEVETDTRPIAFHELCLPLSDDVVDADTILFASYAKQKTLVLSRCSTSNRVGSTVRQNLKDTHFLARHPCR
jgi:hypothetical protein